MVACQTCAWWAAKEYKAIEGTRQVAAGIGALKQGMTIAVGATEAFKAGSRISSLGTPLHLRRADNAVNLMGRMPTRVLDASDC